MQRDGLQDGSAIVGQVKVPASGWRKNEDLPISFANARKNWRSANVVSTAKKWEKMPMIIRSSSVGSL